MRNSPQKKKMKVAGLSAGKFCFICLMFLMLSLAIVGILMLWPPPAQKLSLIEGERIERDLPTDETHSYSFELSQQSFLRIDFYSPNIDLFVSIALPGGNESLECLKNNFHLGGLGAGPSGGGVPGWDTGGRRLSTVNL